MRRRRNLLIRTPPSGHWDSLLRREFEKETDRACAILAVALLDTALETLLRSRLVPVSTGNDSLLDGPYAPIGSFSARIDLAHRIGIVSLQFARDLHLIRRIRNDFVHNISGCTFDDSAVRSRVQELTRSHSYGQRNPETRKAFPVGTKGDFQLTVSWMQWNLRGQVEHVVCISPHVNEWGYTS